MTRHRRTGSVVRALIAISWIISIVGFRPSTVIAADTTATNLPVSFSTSGPCGVTTGALQPDGATTAQVSLSGAGTCNVTASQTGDATYAPASPVTRSFTINRAKTTLTLGTVPSTPYHDAVTLSATVSPASVSGSVTTGTVVFSIDGTTAGSAPVNSSGVASTPVTVNQTPGPHSITASFTSTNPNLGDSVTAAASTLTVTTEDVTLSYSGDTSGDYHDGVTMKALLSEDGNTAQPIAGKSITFSLGGQTCSGDTTAQGIATCALTLPSDPSLLSGVTASFAGDNLYGSVSSGVVSFSATKEQTSISYTGAGQFPTGSTPNVTALLKEDGTTGLSGKSVRITFGTGNNASSCTGITDAGGVTTCTMPMLAAGLGNAPITATFLGDGAYLAASDSTHQAVVYGYLPKGAFVLGDTTAHQAAGTTTPITYWGVHWGRANTLSHGTPPAAFFGYARTLSATPPTCGSSWTTSPGASSLQPPITPPAYMAVVVADRITQSGSTIQGDVVQLAIVKTTPGSLGAGLVVSTFCPITTIAGVHRTLHQALHLTTGALAATSLIGVGEFVARGNTTSSIVSRRTSLSRHLHGVTVPTVFVKRGKGYLGLHSRHLPPSTTGVTGTTPQQITFDPIADHSFGDTSFSISARSVTAKVTTGGLPPDPATVASPIDGTVATTIGTSTAFLYTGPNPIQTGVVPGTINPIRAAVLKGTVLDKDSNPLSGVAVTVLGHPEFGQTLSRADGKFDLAANGGGQLTVNYARDGYFPAQRQVNAPWQDYATVPDVVLIAQDSKVTAIDLTATLPIQVAQGNTVTDGDGTRRATIFIPQGTAATMTLPDGSTQPLSTLHVRATEYTVGPNGPERMPAALPPTSGYTYAVDYSVDEAQAAGATHVQFNHPVISYLQNFLNFPVGTAVPAGSYDRTQGKWMPENNGRVIQILSVTNGMADLDVTGSGTPADAAALAALGITDAERTQLAITYAPGDTLWRTPLTHFSPWDCNFPVGPPNPSGPPPGGGGGGGGDGNNNKPKPDPCDKSGSIIGCLAQTLGERIGITGTPFSLAYESERAAALKDAYKLTLPLSGPTLPGPVVAIQVEIRVAGQYIFYRLPPAVNQTQTFTWDGKDGYGRLVQGSQQYSARVGYTYKAIYMQPAERDKAWAASSGEPTPDVARQELTLWQTSYTIGMVGTFHPITQKLGGWSLDAQHEYDPNAHTLYLGTGERRNADALTFTGAAVGPAAGTGGGCASTDPCGDGGPANQATFRATTRLAIDALGAQYITDFSANRIRRVGPDGTISTVAGSGVACAARGNSCGDGGPATQAQLNEPTGIAVAPDGTLYIADAGDNRIRRVSTSGVISTVAGDGSPTCGPPSFGPCFGGDGGPGTQAKLQFPSGVSVGPDGSLYIADTNNYRIRRLLPDGTINTEVGDGSTGCQPYGVNCFGGDSGPAAKAQLNRPSDVVAAPDGSVYIMDAGNLRVRRVGTDGIISTFAGDGTPCLYGPLLICGDGGPAKQARFYGPESIALAPDGTLYIADAVTHHVRMVLPNGSIVTAAGGTVSGTPPSKGGPAGGTDLFGLHGVAVSADGRLLLTTGAAAFWVGPVLSGLGVGERLIPSTDGSEVYVFDSTGRHLRTLDALTGALRLQFVYDGNGFLSRITDGNGNATTIERDSAGNPTTIVAPGGQRTTLTLDSNGYLASVANPAGNNYQLVTTGDGALTSLIDPNGQQHTFQYDANGLLTKDQDPAGGNSTLVRTDANDGTGSYSVTLTTALGRATTYSVDFLPSGDRRFTKTDPSGGKIVTVQAMSGQTTTTSPDGTVATLQQGPDPRWSMLAPLVSSETIKTPAGLQYSQSEVRTATLSNPIDPLSLTAASRTLTVNSRDWTTSYTAGTHRLVLTSPGGRHEVQTLDANGFLVQDQIGGLTPATYSYDAKGRLTTVTQGSRVSTTTYDAAGNVATRTDPAGRTFTYGYDAAGRVISQTGPDGTSSLTTSYDAAGNLTAITPPGRTAHTFGYSPVSLLTSYTAPAVGGNTTTQFSLNADKQLTTLLRPDGTTTALAYDGGGRLQSITTPSGQTAYSYDAVTGALTGITTPDGGSLSDAFDGRLPTSATWTGTVTGSVSSTYNADFQPATTSVNGANPITSGYDPDGLLSTAGAETLSHDPSTAQLYASTLGNYSDSYTYSDLGEVNSHSAQYQSPSGPVSLFSDQFTVDALGRTTQKIETIAGVSHTFAYSYDVNGRLTKVTVDNATTEQYSYDANGNRLTNGAQTATYDGQDRLTTSGTLTYAYTAAGELSKVTDTSSAKVTSFTHDALGSLIAATLPDSTHLSYVLDGQRRRIGKLVNGTLTQGFLYANDLHPIAELDGSNAVVSRFVYGSTGNVPDYLIKGGVTYRIVSDELSSPRLVVNTATGQVVQQMDYDAFGRVITDTNPGFQPFGFGGGLYDRDTGLVHLGSRDYDPTTGRWISKDPKGFGAGDTNLYAYVGNDPVNWIDPDGRDPLVKVPAPPTTIPAVPVKLGDYEGTIGPFSYDPNATQTTSQDDALSRNAEREKQGGPDPLACKSHPGDPGAPNPLGPAFDEAIKRLRDLLPKPFRQDSPPQAPLPPDPWVPHGPDRPYPLKNPTPPLPAICITVDCR